MSIIPANRIRPLVILTLALLLLGAACQQKAGQNTRTTNQASANANIVNSAGANINGMPDIQAEAGRYVEYSDSVIANTAGQKILFFHAAWCPQCRQLEKSINAGPIPSGVTIIKIDYDSMQSLRQRYGVTLQTTVVLVDDQGNLVKKFVAYDDPSLSRVVQELL